MEEQETIGGGNGIVYTADSLLNNYGLGLSCCLKGSKIKVETNPSKTIAEIQVGNGKRADQVISELEDVVRNYIGPCYGLM